jgi:uncharacterized protein (TIGR02598 family)
MSLPNPTKSVSGFSLVEIVIALAVIAFCLVPIIGLLGIASKNGQGAEETTDSTLVLQSQETILQTQSFDSLTSQLKTGTPSPIYYYAAGGRYLGQTITTANSSLVLYRCTIQQTTTQLSAITDDRLCANLLIQYPAPGYAKQKTFPVSFFRYGPR